ncbi:MAG: DUF2071 domain-containing protein [Acidobacteria bacterium]|nr:DUF2071 domain-containing protein [Acidobacteriota bacterium]MBV8891968.1 DUF2071 domain-containing protein [Acidobacteriota bacterium]
MSSHALLRSAGHRPWPLPKTPWIMLQTWHDLLFAHWPISPHLMRQHVPAELPLDIWDGQAWMGIVPFHMSNVRLRWMPPLPALSAFPELNVRTYVTLHGKAGVYFFSLDAASLPAVWGARRFYHLPYYAAEMHVDVVGECVTYSSRRKDSQAVFAASYGSGGGAQVARQDSLEYWLSERYCLYTVHRGRVYRGEIHHRPWALARAGARFEQNTMAAAASISLPPGTPLLHFAKRQDVLIWPLKRVV